eukprot:scaffold73206_cov21-Tisochrysis_lutea.AAC.1
MAVTAGATTGAVAVTAGATTGAVALTAGTTNGAVALAAGGTATGAERKPSPRAGPAGGGVGFCGAREHIIIASCSMRPSLPSRVEAPAQLEGAWAALSSHYFTQRGQHFRPIGGCSALTGKHCEQQLLATQQSAKSDMCAAKPVCPAGMVVAPIQ